MADALIGLRDGERCEIYLLRAPCQDNYWSKLLRRNDLIF